MQQLSCIAEPDIYSTMRSLTNHATLTQLDGPQAFTTTSEPKTRPEATDPWVGVMATLVSRQLLQLVLVLSFRQIELSCL
jgi:hypothetical protein